MNQEKNRMCAAFGIALIFSLVLNGCTLAEPALQQAEEEQLCGILVAVGEQEAWTRHEREMKGRTFSGIRELEESLNACLIAEGTLQPDGSIAFEGVEGHMLGIVKEETGEHPTTHFINDGYFTKVKADTTVTDEGTENTISGSILAVEDLKEPIYMYPVYCRSDGSYYTVLDNCGYLMAAVHNEGEVYGQTFQWETTEEINGRKEKNSAEIRVSLEMAKPVERTQVRMYNDRNELLKETEISGGTEETVLEEETAYVIVEEEKAGGSVQRSLYDWEESSGGLIHLSCYLGTDGLIEPKELLLKKNSEIKEAGRQ